MRAFTITAVVCVLLSPACRREGDEGSPLAAVGVTERARPLTPAPLPKPDYTRDIGTAHPVSLVSSAENGRWVVACEARTDTDGRNGIHVDLGYHGDLEGDAMTPFLFRGGGDGVAIDELVAVSRDDRWLVVMRGGKPMLIDDVAGTESELPDLDTRPDQNGHGRIATFDDSSRYLAFFRPAGSASHVVVRDLARQRERELTLPDVVPWRIDAEHGSWGRVIFIRRDTDHDGKRSWPSVDTNAAVGRACTGPATSYSVYGRKGDEPESAWLSFETGELREDKGLLGHLGTLAIVKASDHSIRIGSDTVIPASCDAEVFAASDSPRRLAATCASKQDSAPVELFGNGFRATLTGQSAPRGKPHGLQIVDTPYLCANPDTCFALADGKPVKLRGDVVWMAGTTVLTREKDALFVTTGSGAPRELPGVSGYPSASAKGFVAVDTTILDAANGQIIGNAPRAPFALDTRGRALVPTSGGERDFPAGPLRWVAPAPGAASAVPAPTASGPTPAWTIDAVAVDERGAPVPKALVLLSEAQLVTNPDGSSSPRAPWIPQGVAASGLAAQASFSQWASPDRTDASGHVRWAPHLPGPHAIMVVADDGRTGAADAIRTGVASARIVLRAPAALKLTCRGFTPMSADLGAGGIDISSGHRRLGAACGETVRGLPAGHYVLAAKQDAYKYAGTEVDLRPGATTEAVLAIRPAGTIKGRVVEYPGDTPVGGVECEAEWPSGERDIDGDPGVKSQADGSFTLHVSQGRIHVWCEGGDHAPGMGSAELGATPATVTVRVVRFRKDGVDFGAEIDAEPDGARVVSVTKAAARAGLQVGDLVRAVDGVPLAGLARRSMQALAFFFPPSAKPRWTVVRAGATLELTAP